MGLFQALGVFQGNVLRGAVPFFIIGASCLKLCRADWHIVIRKTVCTGAAMNRQKCWIVLAPKLLNFSQCPLST